MKILTLNIWRYFNWEERKEKVISFLKDKNTDIVFLQEVAYDERLKKKYNNQVHEINNELNYPYSIFEKQCIMKNWHKKPIDWLMYYGLGILSKFKIKHSEMVILPHACREKDFGFLHATLETPEGDIDIINVHLENTDQGSKEHLSFILNWCKEKNIFPIIAGDFNMKQSEVLKKMANKDFHISFEIKPYLSFMPTDFSNNREPITLDYIIADREKFKIRDINCIEDSPSDHKPLLADIEIKQN